MKGTTKTTIKTTTKTASCPPLPDWEGLEGEIAARKGDTGKAAKWL